MFREGQWAGNMVWWCSGKVSGQVIRWWCGGQEGQWAGNMVWWCSGKVSGQVTRWWCGGQGRSVSR